MPKDEDFDRGVFVNCPLDEDYDLILQAVLFCLVRIGLKSRIATERSDAGELRISKLLDLIQSSRYSIHDLCRCQARVKGEYYRLNMPFELGLDFGCRRYGDGLLAEKVILVLEEERYRYQAAISDLAGSDIEAHRGDSFAPLTSEISRTCFETLSDSLDSAASSDGNHSNVTLNLLTTSGLIVSIAKSDECVSPCPRKPLPMVQFSSPDHSSAATPTPALREGRGGLSQTAIKPTHPTVVRILALPSRAHLH